MSKCFGELGGEICRYPNNNSLLSKPSEEDIFLNVQLENLLRQFQTFNPLNIRLHNSKT